MQTRKGSDGCGKIFDAPDLPTQPRETAMNRAEIDIYAAQMEIEKIRLRARLRLDHAAPAGVREEADAAVKGVDKLLKHPGLEVLKQGLDNFDRLPPDQRSEITQLYTLWIANAQDTLKTFQMLSEAVG